MTEELYGIPERLGDIVCALITVGCYGLLAWAMLRWLLFPN